MKQDNLKKPFSSGLIISEEVIATIAANAARDVDGVADLGSRPADLYSTFKIGSDDIKHAAVQITDYDIRVHVYIIVSGKNSGGRRKRPKRREKCHSKYDGPHCYAG